MADRRIKVFAPEFALGYMQAATITEDIRLQMDRPGIAGLPPRDQWRPFRAEWWHRSERRAKIPDISLHLSSLCVRRGVLARLGDNLKASVEALPFVVENEPWDLLRPLHTLNGVDTTSSVPKLVPVGLSPDDMRLTRYEWLNAIDPQAEQALIFDTLPDGGVTWVTEEFVRRVKAAGLQGLRFVHKGYLVRDIAQVQPRPAQRARKSTRPGPPPARVSDLDPERQALRDQARAQAAQVMPDAVNAAAELCLALMDDWLNHSQRDWNALEEAEQARRTALVAVVFGDLLCRQLGWQWAVFRQGDEDPQMCVATANGSYAVWLERLAYRHLAQGERTLRLLYNMIAAGSLPAPRAQGAAIMG